MQTQTSKRAAHCWFDLQSSSPGFLPLILFLPTPALSLFYFIYLFILPPESRSRHAFSDSLFAARFHHPKLPAASQSNAARWGPSVRHGSLWGTFHTRNRVPENGSTPPCRSEFIVEEQASGPFLQQHRAAWKNPSQFLSVVYVPLRNPAWRDCAVSWVAGLF